MFESARLRGGSGNTGSTPDCIVAERAGPSPTFVRARNQNM